MKLRTLLSATLLMLSTATMTVSAAELSANSGQSSGASVERLNASEPVTIDLGNKIAVVFYYTDANGDRLLVTAIGPKDPDSGVAATQQIIKMDAAGQYVINITSDESGSTPMKLSARFEGNELVVYFNKV